MKSYLSGTGDAVASHDLMGDINHNELFIISLQLMASQNLDHELFIISLLTTAHKSNDLEA